MMLLFKKSWTTMTTTTQIVNYMVGDAKESMSRFAAILHGGGKTFTAAKIVF